MITLLFFVVLGGIALADWMLRRNFYLNCGRFLEKAKLTSSVEVARKNLYAALMYLKEHGLTEGNTSLIKLDPNNDLRTWYDGLLAVYRDRLNKPSSAVRLRAVQDELDYYQTPKGIARYRYVKYFGIALGVWLGAFVLYLFIA